MGLRKVNRSNSAVSEVMGTILLLMIVVGLFSVVSISVFNLLPFNPAPSADIICQVNGDNIILTHRGGDALSLDTKIGFSAFNGSTQYIVVKDYLNTTEKADGKWSIGEKIVYSNSNLLQNKIQVMVVDPSSNSIILSVSVPIVNSISVTTGDATSITMNSANVPMLYDFQSQSGSVRFTYRPSDGGWTNTSWISKSGSGSYNIVISSLSPVKLYYFKGQLLYNSTIIEGDQKSFTTLCPVIDTSVNMISPYALSVNPLTITAAGNSDLDNVTLYYRWSDDNISWNGGFNEVKDPVDNNSCNMDGVVDNGSETNFPNAQGITSDDSSMTIQEANQGGVVNENNNYVDAQSNSHTPNDLGTHSSFAEMQDVDGSYDTLTEENNATTTLINQESFEGTWRPTGWSESPSDSQWNRESDQEYHGSWSADFDGADYPSRSGNLITPAMNCSAVDSIYVDFYTRDDGSDDTEYYLDFYDGTSWDQITRLDNVGEGSWYHYTNTITDSQYFKSNFQIRWRVVGLDSGEHVYLDLIIVRKIKDNYNYNLDIEVRWTSADYDETNEYLCIYGGTQDSEALQVDVWNGAAWTNVITDLSSGWNNVSVSPYLTSSSFEIRFIDTMQSVDASQSSWQVEGVVLHTWSGTNYLLDFEYQWTAAVYNQANKQVCLYVTSHTGGTENLLVNYWTGSAWSLLGTITTTGWSNFTATGLSSPTYTIQLKGATESGDSSQDSWSVDLIMLHTWNTTGGSHGQNWIIWSNANNPDTSLPWSWNFDFPKGVGYYEFYTIGKIGYCGGDIEPAPPSADARCRKT